MVGWLGDGAQSTVEFAGAVFRLTPVVVRLIPSAIWPALPVVPTLPSAIRPMLSAVRSTPARLEGQAVTFRNCFQPRYLQLNTRIPMPNSLPSQILSGLGKPLFQIKK